MQRHHTGIMCALGLLTYPWGARVSAPLTISSAVKSNKVWCCLGQSCLFSVGSCSKSNTGRAAQELWKVSLGSLLLHQDTPDHESLSCGSLTISDQLGLALAKFPSGELKLDFTGRPDARFVISHALADLMSRLCPPALPAFSCDF